LDDQRDEDNRQCHNDGDRRTTQRRGDQDAGGKEHFGRGGFI